MTTFRFASVGSISQGTLRDEDLLEAFASELEYHVNRNTAAWCSDADRADRDRYLALVVETGAALDALSGEDDEEEPNEENIVDDPSEIIMELEDALDDFAPPYCYFGTHEVDGSDFGFWPDMSQIDELPRITDCDPEQAKALGEDCVYVNDHGNVTVYGADGSIILEIV